jgi:hypothetical protein
VYQTTGDTVNQPVLGRVITDFSDTVQLFNFDNVHDCILILVRSFEVAVGAGTITARISLV